MVKKQLIIEKSIDLFARQGFDATSVQQITEQCGISKGAFYLSFKSKDELIMAIIDYFMMHIISDIDRTVRTCADKGNMLSEFYYSTFHFFRKHSGFAKIFIKEQALPLHAELLMQLNEYDIRINRSILYMLEQLFGKDEKELRLRYDLLICIKGFMRTYMELYLHGNVNIDLDLYVRSLVEKTNLLAREVTIPLISEEMCHKMNLSYATRVEVEGLEQILSLIELKVAELEHPLEVESLEILNQSLRSEKPSIAVIKGMLENVKDNPECNWLSYLIREHYQL
jgi:AcrR family transcriptional regulator